MSKQNISKPNVSINPTQLKIDEKHIKPEDKKEKGTEKEIKIPNSLIIYIKTRTPNYYKINYEPSMTVPKSKSHTVFFEPLIKYYESPIKNIPSYAPKDSIYTQFFEANEFDTMINRILSNFMYSQKKRTFVEAYNDGTINNNIKYTLENLFKNDQLFYINNNPYTIVGSTWNSNDWQIDKKPIEMLLQQNPYMKISKLIEEAKKEIEVIPETMRQGEYASRDIVNKEAFDSVSNELQNTSLKTSKDNPSNSFIGIDELKNIDDDNHLKKLYTKYIQLNEPINYLNTTDKIRDTLTLSILIDPKELLKFINKNKNTDIVNSYAEFIKSKTNLFNAENEYKTANKNIVKYKDKLDEFKKTITIKINNSGTTNFGTTNFGTTNFGTTNSGTTNFGTDAIKELIQLKLDYIEEINTIIEVVNKLYELQKIYFSALVQLLTELKNDYVNIIKYYERPAFALKCIDYDINCINALITKDNNNIYSKSYFENYDSFKKFYEIHLSTQEKAKQELIQVNYTDEIKKYASSNDLLYIEEKEYEITIISVFMYYSYNQFDIWILLFKSLQTFTYSLVAGETSNILIRTNDYITNYNNTYDTQVQTDFLNILKVDGVKANYKASDKTFDWFLVQKDGTRCLEKDNALTKQYGGQEKLYVSLLESKIQSFDAVMLYITLLEILCLRQYHVYIAEQNLNQFKLEHTYSTYGLNKRINYVVNSNNDVSKLDVFTKKYKNTNTNSLDEKMKNLSNKIIIIRARLSSIKKAKTLLIDECTKLQNLSIPSISINGFIDKCNLLLKKHFTDIPQHSFRSSYWLEKEITNYDVKKSSDLMYYISEVIKDGYYDHILDNKTTEYLNWMVYNNKQDDGLLVSVCDALNGQLDLAENDTNNKYTDIVDGKKRFTIDSLKRLISENQQQGQQPEIILQKVLKIKFITFEMFPRSNKKIQLGDIVKYGNKTQKKTGRVFKINTARGGVNYDIYDGESLDNVTSFIRLSNDNVATRFRVNCTPIDTDFQFTDYIFLLMTKTRTKTPYYRLIKNTENNKYIYNFGDIPNYILYFIFINCYWNSSDPNNSVFNKINDFANVFAEFQNKKENIEIGVSNRHDYLNDELETINKTLISKKNELRVLKNNQQTNENDEKMNILKQDIFDLKQRQELLEGKIDNDNQNIVKELTVPKRRRALSRGEAEPQKTDELRQLEPIVEEEQKEEEPISGGALPNVNPSNMYSPYNMAQFQNPQNPQYPQYSQYPQNPQNQLYPFMMNNMMMQQIQSYNESKNKQSKLSFYISIELELFPGKSVNALQKTTVKCNSTFDKIREAYAEIFGYQYRPKPYYYNGTIINDTNNKTDTVKTDTVKNDTVKTYTNNKTMTNKVGGFNKTVKIKRLE